MRDRGVCHRARHNVENDAQGNDAATGRQIIAGISINAKLKLHFIKHVCGLLATAHGALVTHYKFDSLDTT